MLKKDLSLELQMERAYSEELSTFLQDVHYQRNMWMKISMLLLAIVVGLVFVLSYASNLLNEEVTNLEHRVNLVVDTPVELTPEEYIRNENFQWDADTMVAIAICESDVNWMEINPDAINYNMHTDGSISIDRGVFAINSKFHPDLSNSDAFDFKKNIDYAYGMWEVSGINPWYARFSECYEEIR